MRFLENGPIIPDLLLERCDAGRVVFFCGAGVSRYDDIPEFTLPDFFGLTKSVIEHFDPAPDSEIMRAYRPWTKKGSKSAIPLDQIFQLLHQEFGRDAVNDVVTRCLTINPVNGLVPSRHKNIARISTNRGGTPQIVTTNFDLLFELAISDDTVPINVAPSLPDLSLGMPSAGITYLHGRLTEAAVYPYPYVLSSADFGRAYLAEAWATKFVRSLLSEYTVVLIGYQAEDPPIRYLLQGLNHDGSSDRSNLYAFDKGKPEDIEVKWQDRGVTPLAYFDHPVLWETIEAWAERTDNPKKWRHTVNKLAQNDPKTLKPHERGQVAHLIRTTGGAKQFSNSDPLPNPEWINVFDASTRAAQPSRDYGHGTETFVPLDAYGLDDDPPQQKEEEQQTHPIHENLLEWNRSDGNLNTAHRIGGRQVEGQEAMPSRLLHLVGWIGKNLDSPAMAWWAARQHGLHPRLIATLKLNLRNQENFHKKARKMWNLILEFQSGRRRFFVDNGWFDLKCRINMEGWNRSILRDLDNTTKPKIVLYLPAGVGQSRPPSESWHDVNLRKITCVEIKFPDLNESEIQVPDEVLKEVVMILQTNFQQASGLLAEIGASHFRTPTSYQKRDVDGKVIPRKFDADVYLFINLFERLAKYDPNSAAAIATTWPINDVYFFRKLKLFALNHSDLFPIDQTFTSIKTLNDDGFWHHDNTRELLFLLTDRWIEFNDAQQREISNRILAGPPKPDHLNNEGFVSWRNQRAAYYGRFLESKRCILPPEASKNLNEIIATLPNWSNGPATSTIIEHDGRIGSVETDDDPAILIDLPINKIVECAQKELRRNFVGFTENRPFTGLAKVNPRKALSALSVAAKLGDYPTDFWAALIQNWPEDATDRLFKVFMLRLIGLPQEAIGKLRYPLDDWLRDKLPNLLERDKDLTWKLFDHCISSWTSDKGASTKSGLGEIFVGGEVINRSRRTYNHAINGAIGKATEGIIRSIRKLKLNQAQGIPDEFKLRLETLLKIPGEGGDHCVSVLAKDICLLNHIDPDWTTARLLPLLKFDHHAAEPAWNGLLHRGNIPSSEILIALKKQLIDLFPRIYDYGWEQSVTTIGASWLLWMAIFRKNKRDGLTKQRAKTCLRKMNVNTRTDSISCLGNLGKINDSGWKSLVIPFLEETWPKEKSFRTSAAAASWISILYYTGDDFPAVYAAVREFLVPVDRKHYWLHRFTKDFEGDTCLTCRYPAEVLDLIDKVTPKIPDYPLNQLSEILELIEETNESLVGDPRYVRLLDLVERG